MDANHADMIEAFRACGWTILQTFRLGQDAPDFMAAKGGRVVAVEVKTAKGKVKPGQAAWLAAWPAETAVVRTYDDVVAVTNRWTPTGEFDTPTLGDA